MFQWVCAVEEIKAHQSLDGLVGDQLYKATGNTRADELAVRAVLAHPELTPAQATDHARLISIAKTDANIVAGVWDAFP